MQFEAQARLVTKMYFDVHCGNKRAKQQRNASFEKARLGICAEYSLKKPIHDRNYECSNHRAAE